MKLNKVNLFRIFFETQFNHWALYPIILCMILWNKQIDKVPIEPEILGWTICGLFPILSRLYGSKIRRRWLYLLCSIATTAALIVTVCCISNYYPVYVMMLIIYLAISVYMNFVKNEFLTNGLYSIIIPMGLSVVALTILNSIHCDFFDNYYVMFNVIIMIVYVLGYFFEHFVLTITKNAGSAGNMPGEAIFSSGFTMLLVFLAVILLVIFVVLNSDTLMTFFDKLRDYIFHVIEQIMSLFGHEITVEPVKIDPLEFGEDDIEISNSNWLMLFNRIFWAAVYIFSTVVVTYVLAAVFRAIVRFFGSKSDNAPKVHVENSGMDVREKCVKTDNHKKDRMGSIFLNDTERVRKIFQKKVASDKRLIGKDSIIKVGPSLITAREYGEFAGNMKIADIYEKARYSGEQCNKDDVKMMKEACK